MAKYRTVTYFENFEDHQKLEYFVNKFLRINKYSICSKTRQFYNFEDNYFQDSVKIHKILKIFYPQKQVTLQYLCGNSIIVTSSRSDATRCYTL